MGRLSYGIGLRLAGERCMQLRNAIVKHHGSAITGLVSAFTLFQSYRNRLWLVFKSMPLPLLLLAVPLNVLCSMLLIFILARRGKPAMAALHGLLAGLRPGAILAVDERRSGRTRSPPVRPRDCWFGTSTKSDFGRW